jgi:hypothetical protein
MLVQCPVRQARQPVVRLDPVLAACYAPAIPAGLRGADERIDSYRCKISRASVVHSLATIRNRRASPAQIDTMLYQSVCLARRVVSKCLRSNQN